MSPFLCLCFHSSSLSIFSLPCFYLRVSSIFPSIPPLLLLWTSWAAKNTEPEDRMSGSQLPWKAMGRHYACIRLDDWPVLCVLVQVCVCIYSPPCAPVHTHVFGEFHHMCVGVRYFSTCQCVCVFFVSLQPSSWLTCAEQPQGPKGFCSLSANPNKAQAEPEWRMSALLVKDGEGQPGWVCVCMWERHRQRETSLVFLLCIVLYLCLCAPRLCECVCAAQYSRRVLSKEHLGGPTILIPRLTWLPFIVTERWWMKPLWNLFSVRWKNTHRKHTHICTEKDIIDKNPYVYPFSSHVSIVCPQR